MAGSSSATPAPGAAVTAEDLKAAGAMTVILRDAIKPNLLQTLERTPVLVHAGPFGNIATGNSSVIADRIGIHLGDYLITEAGFGSDMGAERFFNIKCRLTGLQPDAAVLVVTVRALKAHSGRFTVVAGRPLPAEMLEENPDDVRAGVDNLRKHIEIVRSFGVSPVVAINAFPGDHPSEHQVYGADGVRYSPEAARRLRSFTELGFGELPVVIAKTHLSISSDATLRGAPTGWTLPVGEVRLAAGAGYVYAIAGEMRTMPGLPKHPAAERIDIDADGQVVGLS
ncbi:hypothetical protein GCM10025862_13420 [Arsenicicoccus piscis]|uniref:formate--tetrahydrofolate ligase n=1 Tax=Arsenicicoccus piscis TaxID=673954 RepID=A0ABQ6HLT0_9MICO|nr:hypothetical protein GCM10025862_13420 [Arsenicicoccus piscis]